MIRQIACTVVLLGTLVGFAAGDEYLGQVYKVEDGKVTFSSASQGRAGPPEISILGIAGDLKVFKGQLVLDRAKKQPPTIERDVELPEGLAHERFKKIPKQGIPSLIITDESGNKIQEMRILFVNYPKPGEQPHPVQTISNLTPQDAEKFYKVMGAMRRNLDKLKTGVFRAKGPYSEKNEEERGFREDVEIFGTFDFPGGRTRLDWSEPAMFRLPPGGFNKQLPEEATWQLEFRKTRVVVTPKEVLVQQGLRLPTLDFYPPEQRDKARPAFDVRALGLFYWGGFTKNLSFEKLYQNQTSRKPCEISRDAKGIWKIVWEWAAPMPSAQDTFWLDEARGFTITRAQTRYVDKKEGDKITWAEPTYTSELTWAFHNGVWLPRTFRLQNRRRNALLAYDLSFAWESVNQPVDAKLFTKEALAGGRKTLVFNKAAEKRVLTEILNDDKPAPRTEAPAAKAPPRAEAASPRQQAGGGQVALAGVVQDQGGRPVAGARVIVRTASPREGVGVVSPFYYPDCGKRAVTDAQGGFTLKDLDGNLVYRLLVVAEGYLPVFSPPTVDPRTGPVKLSLQAYDLVQRDPDLVLRGRVTDENGASVVGAAVEPRGIETAGRLMFGNMARLVDGMAVTDERGEFRLGVKEKGSQLYLTVTAPRLAPLRIGPLAAGPTAHGVKLVPGVTVKGKLAKDDKAVPGMALLLMEQSRKNRAQPLLFKIASDSSGSFRFENVAADGEYILVSLLQGSQGHDALPLRSVHVGPSGTSTNLGTLPVQPGYRLTGRLVLADGKPVPAGTEVVLVRHRKDQQKSLLANGQLAGVVMFPHLDAVKAAVGVDGGFRFRGLPAAYYNLAVRIPGYHLSPENGSFDLRTQGLIGAVDRDLDSLRVLLEAGPPVSRAPGNTLTTPERWDRPLAGAPGD